MLMMDIGGGVDIGACRKIGSGGGVMLVGR